MSLKYEKKNVYEILTEKQREDMKRYAYDYIDFLTKSKTEYKCVENGVSMLEKSGFVNLETVTQLAVGDKVYFVNKEKSIYAAVIGKQALREGVNLIGAHIDSPRIDLKPMPLYEKEGMGLLKTQYYGGIKKYQWLTIPLSMYGVIYTADGQKQDIVIGEEATDPCFTITDLLPHLSKDQLKGTASEFIDPEKMSILFGSLKTGDSRKEENTIKENILRILKTKYGMLEIDFARSEIEFVPAFGARILGIDESMIGGYGQDDRACSYATLQALINTANNVNEKTNIALIVDKEEIGSVGNTSMTSQIFDMFMKKLLTLRQEQTDILEVYYHSKMLSADVSSAVDPCYDEVSDIQNANLLGYGISIEKYTGGNGKAGASDANASYMSQVMSIFDKHHVIYQIGTIGKMGKGGGGTIAYILADKGVEVIDCGTPILCMHSPFEVSSMADIYMTYQAYEAFFKA